jgi:CO/xanthine dehydrogenase Mo-binding subunit
MAVELFAQPEERVEGHLKVSGQAQYAADFQLPGMVWAAFVNSSVPHARIVSINTQAARAVPGVQAVLTGEDIGDVRLGRRLMDWPALARERVRFIGEHVAAVAAESKAAAEEAVRRIAVDYDELPAVFEAREALAEGAPILHPDPSGYKYLGGTRPAVPHPNLQGRLLHEQGDVEAAFRQADHVFEHTFHTARQHQGHIEPHATLVWFDEQGVLHVISTNKTPFALRTQLANATGIPAERIVVDSGFIGGDFGGKGTSIDEFACVYLARATGRPIKAVMSYLDELQSANPRHAADIRLRTACTRDGKFLGHTAEVVFNGGAYAGGKPLPLLVPGGGIATLAPYHVPNTRIELLCAYTNTVPGGHMRSPGEPQAAFAGESHVDMIARELGIDPLELRLRNAVREGQVSASGYRFRESRAVDVLERLRDAVGWGLIKEPLPPGRGRGLSVGVRHVGGGATSLLMRLREDGRIEVFTAMPDQGTGAYTVVQRVAAAVLSVDPRRIVVVRGNTAEAPNDPGAGGSRVTHMLGKATENGAAVLKERLQELAAEVLGWPAEAVRLESDSFVSNGQQVGFEEVARRLTQGAPVEVQGSYEPASHGEHEAGDYNFVAYAAEVEVDRETGQTRVLKVWLAADVGTVINPVAHRGQFVGGFAGGIGTAMMEDLVIEDGKVATPSLGEYKLPTAMDVPALEIIHIPTTIGPGPFGAKMAGEATNSQVAPAIANAIAAAVGARITETPLSAEKVRRALQR